MSEPEVVQGLEPPLVTVVQAIAPPPLDVSTCPLVPAEGEGAPTYKAPATCIVPLTSSL